MKTKDLEKIRDKSIKDLEKEIVDDKKEVAKLILERHINRPKDTNAIAKEKRNLAVLMTVLHQKNLVQPEK